MKIPWRRAWQPTPVFLFGESYGQRSLQAKVHRIAKSWIWLKQLHMCAWYYAGDFPGGSVIKNLPAVQEMWLQSLGGENPLEQEMAVIELERFQWKWKSLSPIWLFFRPHGLYSPWNSPDQNTGVGSCSLLQGTFPTQRSNPGLPHCRWILYQLSHQERFQRHINPETYV